MIELPILPLPPVASAEEDGSSDNASPSSTPLRRMELKATKRFLLGIIPLLLLPLPGILFVLSYQIICRQSNSVDFCNDITWIIPYSPIVFSLYALVCPILNLWLNKNFAPPCDLRRFNMFLLINLCSFNVKFFLIMAVTFLTYRISQSFA